MKTNKSIYLEKELIEKIKKLAKENRRTWSDMAVLLMIEGMKKQEVR